MRGRIKPRIGDPCESPHLGTETVGDKSGESGPSSKGGAERTEGFNAALQRAVKKAPRLRRLIGNTGEFGNCERGRWRQAGDRLNRVSLTAGASNPILGRRDALATYDARLPAGCIQPVRRPPYTRLDEGGREGLARKSTRPTQARARFTPARGAEPCQEIMLVYCR